MDKDDEPSTDRAPEPDRAANPDRSAARPAQDDRPDDSRGDAADPGAPPASASAPGSGGAAEPGASPADAPEGPPGEVALDAFVSGAAYAALGLLGGIAGLIGSFSQDWSSGSVPVAAIVLVGLVFVMVRAAGWGMGTRLGALIPAIVWAVVTFVMSMQQPEGDLVVPGTTAGYVYIVGGLVAAVVAVSLVPARNPSGAWLTAGAPRDARRP
ncbi:DUF6113 family protein [Actinomadura xylanilytica]|uniref:DUF6113 family protein n=1 Tax=Actinomadura xylanilytica TaxID=887459 RepID=UPI00255ABCCC|nr:DUF6113 family protein [Actinomadura xylanilytica]MDL4772177.1 DUF6113 family protein [Actinomadura xylanilytica]